MSPDWTSIFFHSSFAFLQGFSLTEAPRCMFLPYMPYITMYNHTISIVLPLVRCGQASSCLGSVNTTKFNANPDHRVQVIPLHNLKPQSISISRTGSRNHLMSNPKGERGAVDSTTPETEVNDVSTLIEPYHPISPPAHIALSPSCSPGPDCSVTQPE